MPKSPPPVLAPKLGVQKLVAAEARAGAGAEEAGIKTGCSKTEAEDIGAMLAMVGVRVVAVGAAVLMTSVRLGTAMDVSSGGVGWAQIDPGFSEVARG